MTDQNYYDTLGLDETSSFEDIQEAKDRLTKECGGVCDITARLCPPAL